MHHIYQTEGVVLGGVASGDSNRRIFLFGRETGLVGASVQSGRALSSKLRGGVQDYSIGQYSLVHGKGGWKVVGAEMKENIFEKIKHDQERIRIMADVFLLIRKIVEEEAEGQSHGLYDVVKDFVAILPTINEQNLKSAECLVLLRILDKLGFLRADPDLSTCIEKSGFENDVIMSVARNRTKTIKLINESLHAAHVRDK